MKKNINFIIDDTTHLHLCQHLGGVNYLDQNAKAVRAAYQRAWRKKNPEKVREINERYWMRRAEKELVRRAAEKEEETE